MRFTDMAAAAAVGVVSLGGMAARSPAQSSTRAVFVPHYFPVNSVSPIGATIAAFRISDSGDATLVENEPSGEWTQAIALSPNGRFIASANGTSSTTTEELRIYRVEADASLTPLLQTSTPDSPLDMVWVTDDVLAVTRTQSGGSSILTYRWNEAANTLTLADSKPSGYFNSAVTKHPTRPWIYTQDSGVFGGSRMVQRWSVAADGVMTAGAGSASVDPPLAPRISPDGRWMFSGTGAFGANTVAAWSLDPVNGDPAELSEAGSPFVSPGDTPYWTAVSTDSRYVFVGHTRDDTVRTFEIDQVTGAISPTGFSFNAGPRSSLGPFAVLDNFLIVLKDSNDPIGMWVFRIEQNGDLTQIGPLHSTGNRRPELDIAVWSPPAAPACRADVDGDGAASVGDIFAYLGLWFAGDARADFDGSPGITTQDIFDYLSAWFAGC